MSPSSLPNNFRELWLFRDYGLSIIQCLISRNWHENSRHVKRYIREILEIIRRLALNESTWDTEELRIRHLVLTVLL